MVLSPRQLRFYVDRCDIWALAQSTSGTTGLRTAKTYTRVHTAVPSYFEILQSVEAPSVMGRIEGDNLFTRDKIYLPWDVTVDSDHVLVNKSVDLNGQQSQLYGRYWIVSGNPTSRHRRGARRGERRLVYAVQTKTPPAGVTL